MFARKRILSGISTVVVIGALSGCQNGGTVHGVFETPLIRITIDAVLYPINDPNTIDLDVLKPTEFLFDGKPMLFFRTLGVIQNPETGELFQLDDPSWEAFERLTLQTSNPSGSTEPRTSQVIELKGSSVIQANWENLLDPSTAQLTIVVNFSGDIALPIWNVERWPTLDRKLYVFPDGVRGSADPMSIEVSGEATDVFGYLAEFGLLDIDAYIDGSSWSAIVDDGSQCVDIFVNNLIVTTVPLPE